MAEMRHDAFAPVTVTLALVSGPGLPPGEHPDCRISLHAVLDGGGRLDEAAWAEQGEPWPARWLPPDEAPQQGDLHFDEDGGGWILRFWREGAAPWDAPRWRLGAGGEHLRPGEYLTVFAPNGGEWGYRVVGVTPTGAEAPLPAAASHGMSPASRDGG
jgi:hypothetical protein